MRQRAKIILDLLMTALLLLMMAYPVTGQLVHEWMGAGMLLLFIAHHVLNRHWFKTLGRGSYTGLRIAQTAVDVLLLADMLALMFSGIRLSRYVVPFLPALGSAATARALHLLASHWGFVLMGIHLGLHWKLVTARFYRRIGKNTKLFFRLAGTAAALYGVYAAESVEATAGLFAMDTYLSLTAYGEEGEAALEQAQLRIRELENRWSVTDPGSEVYAANHSGGEPVTVSGDTAALVRYALTMAERTDGTLEPTLYPVLTAWGFTMDRFQVPSEEELDRLLEEVDYRKISLEGTALTVPEGMQLDLGAVGKGYAADETAAVLKEYGVESALLDFGGNILSIGTKPDGLPWRVGIRDPDEEGNLGVLELVDQGISVSGGYEKFFVGEDGERYWHILDPATGAPARSGLVQTAVVSGGSKRCDALSTALFVMGREKAVEYWREHQDFEMVLLDEDRRIYITEGLTGIFSPKTGQKDWEVQVIRRSAEKI